MIFKLDLKFLFKYRRCKQFSIIILYYFGSIYPSIFLSIFPFMYLSIYLSFYLHLCFYQSIYNFPRPVILTKNTRNANIFCDYFVSVRNVPTSTSTRNVFFFMTHVPFAKSAKLNEKMQYREKITFCIFYSIFFFFLLTDATLAIRTLR